VGDPHLLHPLLKGALDGQHLFAHLQPLDGAQHLLALPGKFVHQGQGVQLALDGVQAHDLGQRRVDVQGFLGDFLPLVLGHGAHGPQVVQPVGQLDQENLKMGRGPGKKLAVDQLVKGLLVSGKVGDLGAGIDDDLDVLAENLADHLAGHFGHVLHRVVEHGGGQQLRVADVQLLNEDFRHLEGMADIGLAGLAPLVLMGRNRKGQRLPEDLGRSFLPAEKLLHALAIGGYVEFFGRGHGWSLSFLSGHG